MKGSHYQAFRPDIAYLIKSDRWTTLDKLYITQLLPTEYSINITNGLGRYQYNKQWMSVYGLDIRPNIHLMYTGIRWITDWIFIQCMQDSAGLLTGYSFSIWHRSGGFLTEYLFGVCRDPVDFWLNIHLVHAGVRCITYWIFINWARWIGIEYLIVGKIRLSRSELNIQ